MKRKNCKECGTKLEESKTAHSRKFCNERCKYTFWNKEKAYRESLKMNKICAYRKCNKPFVAEGRQRKIKKFCNDGCRQEHHLDKQKEKNAKNSSK